MTVEGIEASGKSTLLAGLAARLGERGEPCILTREPGGTPLGTALRSLFLDPLERFAPLTEAFVLNASRAQLVADVIEPALAQGKHVLCDRFADSTLAYQGFGRGIALATLRDLARIATNGREPDLTLLVDVPVAVSRARVRDRALSRGEPVDRLELEGDAFHERVRAGFLELARETPRMIVLDGTLAIESLLTEALRHLSPS